MLLEVFLLGELCSEMPSDPPLDYSVMRLAPEPALLIVRLCLPSWRTLTCPGLVPQGGAVIVCSVSPGGCPITLIGALSFIL